MRKLSKLKPAAPPLVVACAGLLLSLPAWLYGLPLVGDSLLIISWHERFAAQLWSGDAYPRWLARMCAGLGSPAFFFYAPAPFYVSAILRALLPFGGDGARTLGVAAALALTASGLAAYAWLKQISDERAAAVGAIIYLLAPYHVAVDLYTREAYAELWAFVWIPLALRFAATMKARVRTSFAGLAVSYALLALTHLPATLIFSPVLLAYAYFTSERGSRARATLQTACALALGAGLASIYLLPALLTQANANLTAMLPHLYYDRWTTFTRASLQELYGRILWGELTSACLIVCATASLTPRAGDAPARRGVVFWAAVAALSLLMTTFASGFVWSLLPVVQKVQFPWRFNINVCAATAAVVAQSLSAARKSPGAARTHARLSVFALLLVAFWLLMAGDIVRRDYEQAFKTGGVRASSAELRVWRIGGDAPEYKPRWADSNADDDAEEIARQLCGAEQVPAGGCVRVAEGDATATIERWRAREIDLRVASQGGAQMTVAQFYYPGWTARLDGGQKLPVQIVQPAGLLSVNAPAGAHTINLRLEPTRAETTGRVVSALSLALLLLYLAQGGMRRLRSVPPAVAANRRMKNEV